MTTTTTLTDQLTTIVFGLVDLSLDIPQFNISLPVLEIIHALLINYTYRTALRGAHSNIGWGQGFIATVVMCAGGGSTVAILRGEPLGILKNNRFWGIYGTMYWLMFSNPYFYSFIKTLFRIPGLEQLLTVADGILRNFSVTRVGIQGVDSNPDLGYDKWMAKLICGTLAGCGGGFWIDTFKLTQEHWTFSTPRILHTPTIDMKASFISTVFYLVSTHSELCHFFGLTALTSTEAQVWSALILSSGLVYKSYINKINNQFSNKDVSSTMTPTGQQNEKKND